MTNPLTKAIDELSGSTTELPGALRRLMVVASRIQADELSQWLTSELDGYGPHDLVPEYRRATPTIRLNFAGPMGSSRSIIVGPWDLAEGLRPTMEQGWGDLRQSVAELAALQSANNDPRMPLPHFWVHEARKAIEEGKMGTVELMVLDTAELLVPRSRLTTVMDQVQTTALRLVLALEGASTDAGTLGGPTVKTSPEVAAAVENVTIHLTGDHASLVLGSGNALASGTANQATVAAGDVKTLLRDVNDIVDDAATRDLQRAIDQDGGTQGPEVSSWLEKVRQGGYTLAAGMTTNGAYDALQNLISAALPPLGG